MQPTTKDFDETNRSLFTREANVIITIERADGRTPFITDNDLISFNHIKNGDALSGTLTQDKIIFTARNSNNRLDYDEEDASVYENALVKVLEGFLNPERTAYDSVSGGTYYISSVKKGSRNDRYQFTAQTVLGFMTEKFYQFVASSNNAYDIACDVIAQAEQSKGVPASTITLICSKALLKSVTIDLRYGQDNYSLAEVLQLIAAACRCIIFVDREGRIHIEQIGDVTEHYVLSNKFQYSPITVEYADKIGNVTLFSNHGQTATGTDFIGDKIGGNQTMTIPILNDFSAQNDLVFYAYAILTKGRRRFKVKCRFNPAVDLFDIVIVPNGKDVSVAIITSISASFNGAWKADLQLMTLDSQSVTLDMRICDIELLTIEQLESIRIEQLEPNTISDIDGDYLASEDGELALWEE
jgi:hypothetical protein